VARAKADAEQYAAQAAARDAEAQQKRALEEQARLQDMIPLTVVNERLRPSNQKMLPTGEVVPLTAAAATSAPAAAGEEINGHKVYDISQLNQTPVPMFQARPKYPFALRRSNVSGEATIDFIVDDNGNVLNVRAIKFTHQEFAAAAVEAVAKWKFRAGRKNGANVYTRMQVPIVFSLNEN
jgi:TonB family protein